MNVVLNLLLIPIIGAMGAALATFASYVVAFALRAWTAKKLKPFPMHMGRHLLSSLLVTAQAVVILLSSSIPGWIIVEGALLIAVVALNYKPLLQMAMLILGGRRKLSASSVEEQKPQE